LLANAMTRRDPEENIAAGGAQDETETLK